MARTMLSTSDNPYNPFKQYDTWASYDEVVCGYYSSPLLARLAVTSPDFTPREMDSAIEGAIDDFLKLDIRLKSPVTGKEVSYVKVVDQ